MATVFGIVVAVCTVFIDVFRFWYKKLLGRWKRRSLVDEWLEALRTAEVFEDWEHAALQLDSLNELNLWRNDPSSRSYDWTLISDRLNSIVAAREDNDVHALVELVRSGLVRNLGNIAVPKLYNRSFAGTKCLIEEYIPQMAGAIEDIIAEIAPSDQQQQQQQYHHAFTLSTQRKLDFLHDARQAFGRTTLVLQGGAIFGLCHVGVVKALFLRGLLPRIITGTATGALIASLVAIHTEDELPGVLQGDGIDLSAFEAREQQQMQDNNNNPKWAAHANSGWRTLLRRVRRFWQVGYFLDVKVLEECVRANLGNLTFEEAFRRSKRVLNITVATAPEDGIPTLLNYITAPNVLIWTAAVASNASAPSLYGSRQTTVLCKDASGNIVPWAPASSFRPWTDASEQERKSPLARISQLFNVNHFIVSQARPYLIPFLESDMHGPSPHHAGVLGRHRRAAQVAAHLFRIVGLEARHRLRQLDALGLLPAAARRFLVDEEGIHHGASVVLVPDVAAGDFVRLLETPTRAALGHWIRRGERGVWPAVGALRVRCLIEYEIETAYQRARRLKAGGLRRKASTAAAAALVDSPRPAAAAAAAAAAADPLSGRATQRGGGTGGTGGTGTGAGAPNGAATTTALG